MFDINTYLKKIGRYDSHPPLFKEIICADGFTMSVQASEFHYSTPRENIGPWLKFEIGFPSLKEELIMDYAESPEKPTGTVYGYVPAETVEAVIEKHGGIKQ